MAANCLAVGGIVILLAFLVSLGVSEAASSTAVKAEGYGGYGYGRRPRFATRCQNRKSPCFNVRRSVCPRRCRGSCYIDCTTCRTRCNRASPPPPPRRSPPPPPRRSPPPPPPPRMTPPTPSPPPPPSVISGEKKVRCMNRRYPQCYYKEYICPASCPQSCEIDCITCRPVCDCDKPGTVCQDPKFVGADGITFYFHGKKDHDFCLVTDPNLHINGHFIGKRNDTMQRDFTWVQSLGILFDDHKLFIGAQKTGIWNDAVDRLALVYDEHPIYLSEGQGATWKSSNTGDLIITRSEKTNSVVIEAKDNFKIKVKVVPITQKESLIHNYGITDQDCFAHLDLSFRFFSLTNEVNGVLGQTYASSYVSRVNMGVEMPVLGGDKEFSTSSLFSTDCQVARFMGKNDIDNSIISPADEFADLSCTGNGAAPGGGVVCKR